MEFYARKAYQETKFISTCNPQNDIKSTGDCELWNRQVDLIRPSPVQETTHDSEQYDTPSQPPQAEDWLTKVTLSKFQTLPEVTCVNGIDVKCSGIITPQRLSISQDAFLCSSSKHTHPAGSPFPRPCYRISRTTSSTSTTFNDRHNTKAECSHFRALPTRYVTAFCNHALVTKERMASPLDFTPELQEFWTAHPRESILIQDRCVFHAVQRILYLPLVV